MNSYSFFSVFFFFSLITLVVVAAFRFRVVHGVTISVLIAALDSPPGFFSDYGVSCMSSKLPSTARNGEPLSVVCKSSSVVGQP